MTDNTPTTKQEEGGRLSDAPCDQCGYNGPGYYQPATHPCAARHHALPSQEEGRLIEPSSLRASAALALMYLETGFVACERCGHEIPTKDFDAAYELRDGLATPPHNEDGLRKALEEMLDVFDFENAATQEQSIAWHKAHRAIAAYRQALGDIPSG